jgi:large subunit ribosomal protein L9
MIEVILKQDVEHLGHRGDIVKVAPGYARNYLLPRKLALAVTEGNRRQIEHEKKMAALHEAQERAQAESSARRLAQASIVIARRVGETDTLYGSVTATDIADALAAQGLEVDRRRIQLPDPIKHLGEHSVGIRLHRDVVAQVQVHVVKEGE